MTALLSASKLAVSFGATQALVHADLGVDEGEIVAVMGPSGSGKSTLLHCAAGIRARFSGGWNGPSPVMLTRNISRICAVT